jgi:hypothetical protein
VRFVLDQHAYGSWIFYSATTVRGYTCHPSRKHYPDSEPTSLWSNEVKCSTYMTYSIEPMPIYQIYNQGTANTADGNTTY